MDLAIENRFFAGGDTTVRGYRESWVGPRGRSGARIPLRLSMLFVLIGFFSQVGLP